MLKNISVRLTGVNVPESARALAIRLIELGRKAEIIDDKAVARMGNAASASCAVDLLARNGVVCVLTRHDVQPESDVLDAEIDEHDTPEFAAEKILDSLAETGAVVLEQAGYSPEQEEEIRRRLSELGYIE
jgi:hypothetical protein